MSEFDALQTQPDMIDDRFLNSVSYGGEPVQSETRKVSDAQLAEMVGRLFGFEPESIEAKGTALLAHLGDSELAELLGLVSELEGAEGAAKTLETELEGRKGGAGSGYHGPRPGTGRPGQVGGSASRGAAGTGALQEVLRPSDTEALEEYLVSSRDIETYQRAMALDSSDAQETLAELGITKAEAYQRISEARALQAAEPQTSSQHLEGGGYTAERQVLHDQIAADMLEGKPSVPEGEQPTVIFTGGFPGSGKSSMLSNPEYEDRLNDFVIVDADKIKEPLARADGHSEIGWRAQSYVYESADVAESVIRAAVTGRKNVVFDQTMKREGYTERIMDQFQKRGYRVEIAYADLPMEKAIERSVFRYLRGGRFVDPAYVASHDQRNIYSFRSLQDEADAWKHWDTDVPYGEPAKLIGEG